MKDSKRIALELREDYVTSDMIDKKLMADQLHIMANEDKDMRDRIFVAGVNEIVKQCNRYALGCNCIPTECGEIPYNTATLAEVKCLKNSKLYLIYEIKQEDGNRAICFVYHKKNGKYINLMVEADGSLYLSKEY